MTDITEILKAVIYIFFKEFTYIKDQGPGFLNTSI